MLSYIHRIIRSHVPIIKMKAQLLQVPHGFDYSFSIRKDMMPNINNKRHYHEEIELISFHQGRGKQFIGDHVKDFEPGDIVLVGANLTHYWKYDDDSFDSIDPALPCSTVAHFFEHFMGKHFMQLHETRPLKLLLEKAKKGILIKREQGVEVAGLIEQTYKAKGLSRITTLLQCLSMIARIESGEALSRVDVNADLYKEDNERINTIYSFSSRNFHRKIQLEEISALVNLEPNSFCRYFKSKTGKTYSNFLSETRISYACKLLADNRKNIKQICFESGFNNFSCFHKNFKQITGKTPQNYKKNL